MLGFIHNLLSPKSKYRRIETPRPFEFLLTQDCMDRICECIEPFAQNRHEGIAYIYGRTDGYTTLAIGAIRPDAATTRGSFSVSSVEMARMVKGIRQRGLQLICQLHTHPGQAYHSDGDVDGLKLVCNGYVSIVLPDYGAHLPSFKEAAFYFYRRGIGFTALEETNIHIIPKRLL
jgi:hypothetical protein